MSSTVRIRAGASFPARLGTVNVSWPFVVVFIGDAGVSVDVRPNVLGRFLRRFLNREGSGGDASFWSAAWAELAPVEIGRRAVVLRAEGTRGCRIVFRRHAKLELLVEPLTANRVAVRRVKTTIGWYVR